MLDPLRICLDFLNRFFLLNEIQQKTVTWCISQHIQPYSLCLTVWVDLCWFCTVSVGKLQAVSLFRDSVSSGSRKDGARFHLQANCGGFDFFWGQRSETNRFHSGETVTEPGQQERGGREGGWGRGGRRTRDGKRTQTVCTCARLTYVCNRNSVSQHSKRTNWACARDEKRLYEWAETLHFFRQAWSRSAVLKTPDDLPMIMMPAAVRVCCPVTAQPCHVSDGPPAQLCVCAWSVFGARTHHSAPHPEPPACASSWPQAHWPEEDDGSFSLIRMINSFYNYKQNHIIIIITETDNQSQSHSYLWPVYNHQRSWPACVNMSTQRESWIKVMWWCCRCETTLLLLCFSISHN